MRGLIRFLSRDANASSELCARTCSARGTVVRGGPIGRSTKLASQVAVGFIRRQTVDERHDSEREFLASSLEFLGQGTHNDTVVHGRCHAKFPNQLPNYQLTQLPNANFSY